jgi:hypothetical protein
MNDSKNDNRPARRPGTRVVTGGRDPASYHGFVNPPVYHASTVLYRSAADYVAHRSRYQYGRRGTPTTEALELALQELEGAQCAGVALLPSGLAAISAALLSVVHAGDHILVTDSAYGPTRTFCDQILTRLGITTTYYDPLAGAAVAALMRENTRAVYLESPGSLSFEMQDVGAIAGAAHARGALVLMDNTWASPIYFRPLDHGVDLAIQAGTKYIGGHSDVMLGTVSANGRTVKDLKNMVGLNGWCVGPDDVYLGMRGLRTATRCGSAISPGHRDCSAPCSSRCRRRRCTPFSIRSNCSASAPPGVAMRAWRRLSTARRRVPQRAGSRAARRCASTSASKPSRTSSPTSSAALPRLPATPTNRRAVPLQTLSRSRYAGVAAALRSRMTKCRLRR